MCDFILSKALPKKVLVESTYFNLKNIFFWTAVPKAFPNVIRDGRGRFLTRRSYFEFWREILSDVANAVPRRSAHAPP